MNRAYGANVGMTDKAEHVLILSLAACHGSWICVLILCSSMWVDPLVVLVSVA